MYLNLVQIAESFGVSEKVVEDWIRNEGLPHIPDRGRLIFDRAQVATWAASRGLAARTGFLAPEQKGFTTGLDLSALLRVGGIWRDVDSSEARKVLSEVAGRIPGLGASVRDLLRQRMETDGGINWAPVGRGFALPHLSTRVTLGRDSGVIALLLLSGPFSCGVAGPDADPVRSMLFFVAPSPRAHLDLLGALSRLIDRGPLRQLLQAGAADDEILASMTTVTPPRAAAGGPGGRR